MRKSFYITTTLPYVNAEPHIGFALEIVHADILARYRAALGDEVFFNTGTDEHGLKIYRKAQEAGQDTQAYTDKYAETFRALKQELNLFSGLSFIRTTDEHHKSAAQEFWRRCEASGDIYKKNYTTKYCVGCELEKTDSELVNGVCPIHPNLKIELIDEENYFFRFSNYRERLIELYAKYPDLVVPAFRFNEIQKFVEKGLEDFSISRLAEKMPWGVPVPSDPKHIMYVWFDALVNYISTLGWPSSLPAEASAQAGATASEGKPEDDGNFRKFWGTKDAPNALQLAGKDQIRQQAAMWQAMLMSAGLPPTRQIAIHGFITVNGQKMSKSLGNVIDPLVLAREYGIDALRYFLARHVHPFEDSDFTVERFKEAYNADLTNGLGNLVARVMQMAIMNIQGPVELTQETQSDTSVAAYLETFEFNRAMDSIWERIGHNDALIAIKKPFAGMKSDEVSVRDEALSIIRKLVRELYAIAIELEPFMPSTSEQIKQAVLTHKKPENLFPRKD